MATPKNIQWAGPIQYTDGRAYAKADHGGYEIEVNGATNVAVPLAWNDSNTYSFPVQDLPNVKQGDNTIRLRTVASNGQVSVWTNPVTFQVLSVPQAPTNVMVV